MTKQDREFKTKPKTLERQSEVWQIWKENRNDPSWGGMGITERDEWLEDLREPLAKKHHSKKSFPLKRVLTKEAKDEMKNLAQSFKGEVNRVQARDKSKSALDRMIEVANLFKEE